MYASQQPLLSRLLFTNQQQHVAQKNHQTFFFLSLTPRLNWSHFEWKQAPSFRRMFNWKCMRKKSWKECRPLNEKKVMEKMTVSDAIKCDKSYIEHRQHIIIQLHNIHLVMEMKCNWMCTGLILSCFMSLLRMKKQYSKVYSLWYTSRYMYTHISISHSSIIRSL